MLSLIGTRTGSLSLTLKSTRRTSVCQRSTQRRWRGKRRDVTLDLRELTISSQRWITLSEWVKNRWDRASENSSHEDLANDLAHFFCLFVSFFLFLLSQAYLSILYLKPRIQIILRGKKVQTKLVAKSLSMIENDVYKPQFIVSF